MKRKKSKAIDRRAVAFEVVMIALAITSLVLLGIEIFGKPSDSQRLAINIIDSYIAAIYLLEFIIRLLRSVHPKIYFAKNWYLLLAAIPIPGGVAQFLRIVRLRGVTRLIRFGDHFEIDKCSSE